MSKLLSIGQFVQLTGLTARMVRFYEQLGILLPTKVEPHNAYRYYGYEQTLQAEKIRLLRSLEMPLDEIKQLLEETDPQQIRLRLERHRQHIEDKMANYRQALAALELLEHNQGSLYPVHTRSTPAQLYLSQTVEGLLSQVDRMRSQTLHRLADYARSLGQTRIGPGFAVLRPQPKPGLLEYEFGLAVSAALPSSPDIALKRWPQQQVAYSLHLGPYEPLHLVFRELTLWCHQQQQPYSQLLEVYLVGPLESDDPERYRTEVQYVLEESA